MVVRTEAEIWAEQLETKPLAVVTGDLTKKTIIVTGANSGLGLEACRHFARMNPKKLILACRSLENAHAAISDIDCAAAEAWQLDLGSFQSVLDFSERAEKELERVDVLVANAAIASFDMNITADGYEQMLQVNVLSNLLLALRLSPLLINTAKTHGTVSRIVTVSSGLFYTSTLDSTILGGKTNVYKVMSDKEYYKSSPLASTMNRYTETKLIEVFYTRSLQAHVGTGAPLSVSCLDPGFCISNIRRSMDGPIKEHFSEMEKNGAYTSEEGSRQLVYGAVGGDAETLKGQFFSMCEVREVSDYVLQNADIQNRLWNDAIEVLETVDPKLKQALESTSEP